jgi:hypothetical protein
MATRRLRHLALGVALTLGLACGSLGGAAGTAQAKQMVTPCLSTAHLGHGAHAHRHRVPPHNALGCPIPARGGAA